MPKPTKPTPTNSPDFKALPNFMPMHRPMTVKMIGIITLAPKLMIYEKTFSISCNCQNANQYR